ncbi:MAG: hypothetical protein E3J56_08220 [Candidatus Aminicenantes bacterium]|nr:MAG: hypothetical protein E3J56_08220 [Candidatus Aminicenantes bacterium]
MVKNISKSHLGFVVMLGAVWGLSEAALGMGLRSCASFVSGSLMTGVALFFIAASWVVSRRILGVALLIVIACLFKMFDAFLLSLPVLHGAVANPIFAFIMEGAAFLVLITIINKKLKQKKAGQAILGGLAALLAVNLFPLVKYATGIPACVFPGTGYPLSLYYAPLAVSLSLVTVPLGFLVGAQIESFETKFEGVTLGRKLRYFASPVTLILCLAIILLIRLI